MSLIKLLLEQTRGEAASGGGGTRGEAASGGGGTRGETTSGGGGKPTSGGRQKPSSPNPMVKQQTTTPASQPAPAPTPQIVTIDSINTEIAKIARKITFYDTSGTLIQWLSPYNVKFDTDANVIEIVELAKSLKGASDSDLISYLKAVVHVIPNIGSFSVPVNYSSDLDKYKGQILSENKIIRPILGLAKLLFEQTPPTKKRYEIITLADNKKYLGGERISNKQEIIDISYVETKYSKDKTYRPPLLKFVSYNGLPDEAPLIGQVKIKLNIADGNNRFTEDLEKAIKKYREENGIAYGEDSGYIDFLLLQSLFSDRFKSTESARNQSSQPQQPASTPTQQTNTQKTLPETFKFLMRVVERVNAEPTVNFDNCKIIYQTYPKTVNELREDLVDEINRDRTQYDEEINKIKNALKICSTNRKLQTTGSKVKDFLNVFERGINSIKNLPAPFNLDINS